MHPAHDNLKQPTDHLMSWAVRDNVGLVGSESQMPTPRSRSIRNNLPGRGQSQSPFGPADWLQQTSDVKDACWADSAFDVGGSEAWAGTLTAVGASNVDDPTYLKYQTNSISINA